MSRIICPYDNILCEFNYPPPEYNNKNYPKDCKCENCWRYKK